MMPAKAETRTTLMWVSIVVVVAGALVAFLGVRAAVASYQREKGLEEYHAAYSEATFVAEVGGRADTSARKLRGFDVERVKVFRDARSALLSFDNIRYNRMANRQNELAVKAIAEAVEYEGLVDSLEQLHQT